MEQTHMYYNDNDKILISKLPKNLLKPDGSLFIDFNLSDPDILSDYGFYTVRNDNKEPPRPNLIEQVKNRTISLDKPHVDVIRVWIDTSEA